jgi:hypothetical protein
MLSILEDYSERLQSLHANVERTIAGLPLPALDWAPGPDMNSLGVLAIHVAGAERYWIGDVVGRDLSGRDRAAEFHAHGLDAATLTARLAQTLAHALEHTALHLGHMQITRQLWEQRGEPVARHDARR